MAQDYSINDPRATPLQSGPQIDFEMNVPPSEDLVWISEEVEKSTIACPAGKYFREQGTYPACICRVDNSVVSAKSSPNSYKKWCSSLGNYQECPVWRMKREREIAEKGFNDEVLKY